MCISIVKLQYVYISTTLALPCILSLGPLHTFIYFLLDSLLLSYLSNGHDAVSELIEVA